MFVHRIKRKVQAFILLLLFLFISSRVSANGWHGAMHGSGAYGAYQGCPYEPEESEALTDINDHISELAKERKQARRDLGNVKRDLKKLEGYNRRGGDKKEALNRAEEAP